MPYGLPAAAHLRHGTYAVLFRYNQDEDDLTGTPIWLSPSRTLTILHPGADQDGWNGHIITTDPIRGGHYRLAVPRSALTLE